MRPSCLAATDEFGSALCSFDDLLADRAAFTFALLATRADAAGRPTAPGSGRPAAHSGQSRAPSARLGEFTRAVLPGGLDPLLVYSRQFVRSLRGTPVACYMPGVDNHEEGV